MLNLTIYNSKKYSVISTVAYDLPMGLDSIPYFFDDFEGDLNGEMYHLDDASYIHNALIAIDNIVTTHVPLTAYLDGEHPTPITMDSKTEHFLASMGQNRKDFVISNQYLLNIEAAYGHLELLNIALKQAGELKQPFKISGRALIKITNALQELLTPSSPADFLPLALCTISPIEAGPKRATLTQQINSKKISQ